jgi:hypothetical protein
MRAPCPLVRRGAKVPGGIRKTPPTTPAFRDYSYFLYSPGTCFRTASRKVSGHWDPGEKSHVAATVTHAWFGSCAFSWRHREARSSKWRHADGAGALEPSLVSGCGGCLCVCRHQSSSLWAGHQLDCVHGTSSCATGRVVATGEDRTIQRGAAHSTRVRVGGAQPPQEQSCGHASWSGAGCS